MEYPPEWGDPPENQRRRRAWVWRNLVCQQTPACQKTCGTCRVRIVRAQRFYGSLSDEEFKRLSDDEPHLLNSPERAKRYVHETVRRANSPYEPSDRRRTMRVAPDVHDAIMTALMDGETVSDVLRDMINNCLPIHPEQREMVERVAKVRGESAWFIIAWTLHHASLAGWFDDAEH